MSDTTPVKQSSVDVRLTKFTANGRLLNKTFSKDERGEILKTANANFSTGTAEVMALPSFQDLAHTLTQADPRVAFGRGTPFMAAPGNCYTVKAQYAVQPLSGEIARSQQYFSIDQRAAHQLVVLDHDQAGMPQAVSENLREAGGFVAALESLLWPELAVAGQVVTASSSAGVYDPARDEPPVVNAPESHLWTAIASTVDVKALLADLLLRCWLLGLSWWKISEDGRLLERSIIDAAVHGPERLFFEAPPTLLDGLRRVPVQPYVREGPAAALPQPLTPAEIARAGLSRIAARRAMESDVTRVRAAYRERRVVEMMQANPALTRQQAEAAFDLIQGGGMLADHAVLYADDWTAITVGELLDAPDRWHGHYVRCPSEPNYGPSKALLVLKGFDPCVISHAHGANRKFTFARFTQGYVPRGPYEHAPVLGRDTLPDARRIVHETVSAVDLTALTALAEYYAALNERDRELQRLREWAKANPSEVPPDAPPMPPRPADMPRRALHVAASTGKTTELKRQALSLTKVWRGIYMNVVGRDDAPPLLIAVERHDQMDDIAEALIPDAPAWGLRVATLKGLHATVPMQGPPGGEGLGVQTLCQALKLVKTASRAGLSFEETCTVCPFNAVCAYQKQRKAARKAHLVICTHHHLQQNPKRLLKAGRVGPIFIDEDPTKTLGGKDLTCDLENLRGHSHAWAHLCQLPPGRVPSFIPGMSRKQMIADLDAGRELLRSMRPPLDSEDFHTPDKTIERLAEAAKQSAGVSDALRLLEHLIEHASEDALMGPHEPMPALRLGPWYKDKSDNNARVVNWMGRGAMHPTYAAAPVTVMSATLNPTLLPYAIDGKPFDVRYAQPAWPAKTRIRQVNDRAFGLSSLTGDGPLLGEVATYVWLRILELGFQPSDCLVVAQKEAVKLLKPMVPDGVRFMHFNALTGSNKAADVRLQIVVGRLLPTGEGIEFQTEGLTRTRISAHVIGPRYPRCAWGLPMADGSPPVQVEAVYHPDPIANAVLQLSHIGELVQSVARPRSLNRPDDEIYIDLLTNVPLPVPVTEWGRWDDMLPGPEDACRILGFSTTPGSYGRNSLIAAALPHLFKDAQAVKDNQKQSRSHLSAYNRAMGLRASELEGLPLLDVPTPDSSTMGVQLPGMRAPCVVGSVLRDAEKAQEWGERNFGYGVTVSGFQRRGEALPLESGACLVKLVPEGQRGKNGLLKVFRQAMSRWDPVELFNALKDSGWIEPATYRGADRHRYDGWKCR